MWALLVGTVAAVEPRFPEVVTRDLLDAERTLPADLPAERTLVVVAFFRQQQSEVDTWLPALRDAVRTHGVGLVEVPVVSGVWSTLEDQVTNAMKASIPEEADRRATPPYFGDPEPFLDALGLPGTDEIAVALVARDGRVLWMARGPETPESVRALRAALRQ